MRPAPVGWLYQRLLNRFGPQGWWPVSRRSAGPATYDPRWTAGKLNPRQQWEMALGAILTQNTAWTNVERALANLRRARVLSPQGILRTPLRQLEKELRPSGYFRQKARRLKIFCRHLERRWAGRLDRLLAQPTPKAREELLSLHGIGPETADSILLYAGAHPVFVVDAYTKRFSQRLGLFGYNSYPMVQAYFHQRLPERHYREFHALIVAHAKAHCRARPVCPGCPVASRCSFHA